MDNFSDDNVSDYQERIAPHELNSEARAEYLRDLWKLFTEASSRGMVSLFDAKQIAEDLRVDGEETFLDTNTTEEEKQSITYQRLVQLLDEMGRSSTEEYRDIEFDKGETSEGQQVVYLGPKDYLLHLCSRGGSSGGGSSSAGGSSGSNTNSTDSGESPGAENDEASSQAIYKLKLTSVEITPKRLLLASTGGLMLLICGAIILGIAFLWSSTAGSQEEVSLQAFHDATLLLVEQMERNILEEHTKSMVDQAVVLARWSESRVREEEDMVKHANIAVSSRAARLLDTDLSFATQNADTRIRAEVLRNLADLRVLLPAANLLGDHSPANDTLHTHSALCNPAADHSAWTQNDLVFPSGTGVVALPGTVPPVQWHCANYTTHAHQAMYEELLQETAQTLESISKTISTNKYADSSFNFLLVGPHNNSILTNSSACTDNDLNQLCQDLSSQLATHAPATTGLRARAYGNETYLLGTAAFALPGMRGEHSSGTAQQQQPMIAYGRPLNGVLNAFRHRTVAIVDHLNFNFIRSTEIVVSLWNETKQDIIPQATQFRFDFGCFFNCTRFAPSSVNIKKAFEEKQFGWSLTPDYRPEPVTGAFSYVGAELNMAIVLERDVIELRGISFGRVVEVINQVNGATNDNTYEIEMIGWKDMPLMKQFYAYEPCPASTDCEIDPRGTENVNGSHGIIFRYDCRHCQRVTEFLNDQLVLYQTPKKNSNPNITSIPPAVFGGRVNGQMRGIEPRGTDYNGDEVFVAYSFLENYTTILTAKVDRSEVIGPVSTAITISVVCGIATIIIGMAAVVLLSHKAFDSIEAEWSAYKKQIEREQNKFAELVRGIIPPAVAERLMRGSKIISDNVLTVSFVFVDVCGFHELTRHWSAKHVARYMTYCVTVMDEVAQTCEMTKLRAIGNMYICVGLREDKHRGDAANHPACRAARFSCLTMILFSKAYSHRPQHVRTLKDVFKDVLKEHTLEMPTLRIGIHCGPSISGAFTMGKTSHYDFFGISPSLANRMQQTAQPGRIHVTMMVKEMLKTRDVHRKYIFDASRKTVVRGQGTITSYFMRSVVEPVPQSIVNNLGMKLAVTRVDFAPKKDHNDSASETGSQRSGKSSRSYRSSRSKKSSRSSMSSTR